MKRIISVIIISTALALNVGAVSINPNRAHDAAVSFFSSSPSTKAGGDVRLVWDGSSPSSPATKTAGQTGSAPFYLFQRDGGGFVIISGDDRLKPVLAYSFTGSFDVEDIPDGVRWWAEGCVEMITSLREGKAAPDPEAADAWRELGISTKAQTPVVLLATAEWGQSSPFNGSCPEIGGVRTKTGCVATSCAIMMRYLQYPSSGYGTVPAYTSSSIDIPAHDLGSYDWADMPLSTMYGMTDAQKGKIATLMYDCATALFSTFGTGETSASTVRIQPAMSDYFRFSKYGELLHRGDYRLDQWTGMLKSTLDGNYPVLYQGEDPAGRGGHAFVIDGYDSAGFFHFNWGWEGTGNGYYAIFDSPYCSKASAVFGLRKDEGWSSADAARLSIYGDGMSASVPYIEKGQSFTISASVINNGAATYSGTVKAVHVAADGSVKQVLGTTAVSNLGKNSTKSFSIGGLSITGTIANGDAVMLMYTTSSSDAIVRGNRYDSIQLVYKLLSAVSFEYDKFSGKLTLSGPGGVSYTFNGTKKTASASHMVEFSKPSKAGTYPLAVSNGHESCTINLTF